MARDFRINSDSVILHSGSLVFNGCMLSFMPTFCTGATYVLLDRFEPELVLQLMAAERVTHTVCVPTQIVSLLGSAAFSSSKLTALQAQLTAAESTPGLAWVRRLAFRFCPRLRVNSGHL